MKSDPKRYAYGQRLIPAHFKVVFRKREAGGTVRNSSRFFFIKSYGQSLRKQVLVARTVVSPSELPVGIVTAFCGAPFFLYLLRRRRAV